MTRPRFKNFSRLKTHISTRFAPSQGAQVSVVPCPVAFVHIFRKNWNLRHSHAGLCRKEVPVVWLSCSPPKVPRPLKAALEILNPTLEIILKKTTLEITLEIIKNSSKCWKLHRMLEITLRILGGRTPPAKGRSNQAAELEGGFC